MTEEMGQATRGLPTAIRLCINVICDKLKADYFLEGEAERLAPGLSLPGSDGSVRSLRCGPVPSECESSRRRRTKCLPPRRHLRQRFIYLDECSAVPLKDNSNCSTGQMNASLIFFFAFVFVLLESWCYRLAKIQPGPFSAVEGKN